MTNNKKKDTLKQNISILNDRQLYITKINKIPKNVIKANIAKNGMPFIIYKGLQLHSSYNPEKEAENFIHIDNTKTYNFIFIFGLGYGYHIKEVIKQLNNPNCYIVIFEKTIDIFYSALLYADLSFLKNKQILLYIEENKWQEFLNSLNKTNLHTTSKIKLIYLENEYKLFKTQFDELLKQINSIIKQKIQNSLTNLEFNTLWLKNTIENSTSIQKYNDISTLFNKFQNIATLVISAGPSLSHSINTIKKYQNHFLIIASDTALPTLSEANIIPDLTISLDSQIYNFKDFTNTKKNAKINIIYALSCHNAIPKWNKKGKHFYFCTFPNTHNTKEITFTKWLSKNLKCKITSINSGASVASSAIEIARLIGLKPICLVGQDLSYQFNITHSVDSAIYKEFLLKQTNKINTLESIFHKTINKRKPFTIQNNSKTDFVLNNLLEWLSNYANIYQNKKNPLLINSSKYGLNIKNIPSISIENIVKTQKLKKINKKTIKNNIFKNISKNKEKNTINKKTFLYIISDLTNVISRFLQLLKKEKEQNNIQNNIILLAKKHIEDEFPFTKDIFTKANSYYNSQTDFNPHIYIDILINSINPILGKLKKITRKT